MNDERDEGSSSGLMIGMIIGGVVVLALIAVVALGGALFWLHEDVPIAPVAGGPVAVAGGGGIMEDEAPPGPELILDNPREWLIGVWESKANDGGIATIEFRADGTLHMADKKPGKAELVQPVVKWEVRRDQDTIKVKIDTVKGEPNEHRLRFLDGDRLSIDTMPGAVYQRRGLEPAK